MNAGVAVDNVALAILDEELAWDFVYRNWDNVVDLRKALVAGLKAGCGFDDEHAERLAAHALEDWSNGRGNVAPETRAAARNALAMPPVIPVDEALASRGVSVYRPSQGARSGASRWQCVPTVSTATRKGER